MKKFISLCLSLVLCISLCACSGESEKPVDKTKLAFEASKAAYKNIDIAYEITEAFSEDIYEAWRLGIHESDELVDGGCAYLAEELNLTEAELRDGIVYTIWEDEWDTLSEEEKEECRQSADYWFSYFDEKDNLFSFCVWIVDAAYELNGKTEEAQNALDAAKAQMKELSEKYSDYEHYPNLKGYYTTTASFFDFCKEPDGSFEQIKTTINDYRNEARDYISDLDYIFEE